MKRRVWRRRERVAVTCCVSIVMYHAHIALWPAALRWALPQVSHWVHRAMSLPARAAGGGKRCWKVPSSLSVGWFG